MKHIETKVHINASPETVWQVLMDFANYPKWNPFIREIKGQPIVGTKLTNLLTVGGKDYTFKPKVKEVSPQQEFRWLGRMIMPGLFDGEHYFRLKDIGTPKQPATEFIHGENFKGILVGMLMKRIGEGTQQGFAAMNQALKQEAEAKSQQ